MKNVTLKTNKGTIKLELWDKEAPKTCANFEKLIAKGYYNGLTFHRVEPGFVIQGGCPQGAGTGGPGWSIDCELSPKLKHVKGVLSMARASTCDHDRKTGAKLKGNCTNGSQFFICLGDCGFLDMNYSAFGKVTEGLDVVDKITRGDKMETVVMG